jgi:hypothetical protein
MATGNDAGFDKVTKIAQPSALFVDLDPREGKNLKIFWRFVRSTPPPTY